MALLFDCLITLDTPEKNIKFQEIPFSLNCTFTKERGGVINGKRGHKYGIILLRELFHHFFSQIYKSKTHIDLVTLYIGNKIDNRVDLALEFVTIVLLLWGIWHPVNLRALSFLFFQGQYKSDKIPRQTEEEFYSQVATLVGVYSLFALPYVFDATQ